MATTRRVLKQLLLMHYDRLWLKSGLLDEAWLEQQAQARKASGKIDYQSLEPYHFESFQHALDTRERLTDGELADYLTLANSGRYTLQDAVLPMLIGWRGLRPHQLRFVREYLLSHIPRPFTGLSLQIEAALDRRASLFSLTAEPITDEEWERQMNTGDPDVHHALLSRKRLTAAQLEPLAERGASRAIREAASARLQTQEDATQPTKDANA